MRYVAHGLQVVSPFALPGMDERTDLSLPELELDLFTRPSIEDAWRGCASRRVWEGRLGESETLLVLETLDSPDRRYLFAFGDKALFSLEDDGRRLACAPSEAGIAWQRILLTKVLPNIAMLRGYEALHASAVSSPEGAVLVLAPSGTGKTVLALALARLGWPLMSDDVLILSHDEDGVHAHPGTPHLNLERPRRGERPERGLAHVLGIMGSELWLAASSFASEPRPVSAVCLLERGSQRPLQIRELTASPLGLAPFMLGLVDEPGRERQRFGLYGELVSGARIVSIAAGREHTPPMIAEMLRRHLTRAPLTSGVPS